MFDGSNCLGGTKNDVNRRQLLISSTVLSVTKS